MNILLWILGVLAIIGGIVLALVFTKEKEAIAVEDAYSSTKQKSLGATYKKCRSIGRILLIVGIVCIILAEAFVIIPTGYTGIRTTMGQISNQPVPNGINIKVPFIQSIVTVNNKQQDTEIEDQIWGETTDKTPVYAADITITYKIDAAKSAWLYANVTNINDLVDKVTVASAVKSAMVEQEVTTVTNRTYIEPAVKEKLIISLNEKYGEGTITILKVVINDMDFEPEYNEAIAAKSIASQTQQRQAIENETAVAKAEADKLVAIAKAEAEAESKRIAAQAEADALLIQAEAEAEANNKIAASITDEIIQNKTIEKWDGKLPTVTGDNGTIIDIGTVSDPTP